MIRKFILVFIILGISAGFARAQLFVKTSDLFTNTANNSASGRLNIIQDQALDSLISRYMLMNKNLSEIKNSGTPGMDGWRIQIFNSSIRNAREESDKVKAKFMTKFPDITSYKLFENPGYFKVRVGDFRSKTEATRLFLLISKDFPDAYMVPDFINFPDPKTK
jgi:hypothetical protein